MCTSNRVLTACVCGGSGGCLCMCVSCVCVVGLLPCRCRGGLCVPVVLKAVLSGLQACFPSLGALMVNKSVVMRVQYESAQTG